jgi:hypothetical protein
MFNKFKQITCELPIEYKLPYTDACIIECAEKVLTDNKHGWFSCKERVTDRVIAFTELLKYPNFIALSKTPLWIPSNKTIKFQNTKNCCKCNLGFNIFDRRHHCRCCGESVCDNCNTWSPLPELGYIDSVRICSSCTKDKRMADIEKWLNLDTIEGIDIAFQLGNFEISEKLLRKGVDLFVRAAQDPCLYEVALKCFVLSKVDILFWKQILAQLIERGETKWYINYLSIIRKQIVVTVEYSEFFNKMEQKATRPANIFHEKPLLPATFVDTCYIKEPKDDSIPKLKLGQFINIYDQNANQKITSSSGITFFEEFTNKSQTSRELSDGVVSYKKITGDILLILDYKQTVGEPPPFGQKIVPIFWPILQYKQTLGQQPPFGQKIVPIFGPILQYKQIVGEQPPFGQKIVPIFWPILQCKQIVGNPPPFGQKIVPIFWPILQCKQIVGETPHILQYEQPVGEPPPFGQKIVPFFCPILQYKETIGEPAPFGQKIVPIFWPILQCQQTVGEPPPFGQKIVPIFWPILQCQQTVGEPPPFGQKIVTIFWPILQCKQIVGEPPHILQYEQTVGEPPPFGQKIVPIFWPILQYKQTIGEPAPFGQKIVPIFWPIYNMNITKKKSK